MNIELLFGIMNAAFIVGIVACGIELLNTILKLIEKKRRQKPRLK